MCEFVLSSGRDGKKKPQSRENIGEMQQGKLKSSSVERGSSRTPRSQQGRGQHPSPSCPSPTGPQSVFSPLDLFGALLPSLPSCTPGQETPPPPPQGLGGSPASPSPRPRHGRHGKEDASLFLSSSSSSSSSLLLFFPAWLRGWARAQLNPAFQGCRVPSEGVRVLQRSLVPWAGLAVAASLPPRWSNRNSSRLLKKSTPESPQFGSIRLVCGWRGWLVRGHKEVVGDVPPVGLA